MTPKEVAEIAEQAVRQALRSQYKSYFVVGRETHDAVLVAAQQLADERQDQPVP